MNVPMLDPSMGNHAYMEELIFAVTQVLRSGQYILGREVAAFEKVFANYFDVPHAVGVSSGTDALIASLLALDVGPGDEVICPSFTFFATAGAIHRVGAKPVFVDILPGCFTMDPDGVVDAITMKTKAIVPVHLFGQSADLESIIKIALDNGLYVIEDAAQAIGCEYDGQKVGTFGDTGCFSFFPSKNLGGFGDAGLVITNSQETADKVRSIRNHGMKQQYKHDVVGGNFRIDAMQAALLRVKLKYLPESEFLRIKHAEFYREEIKTGKVVLPPHVRGRHVYNQFTLRVPGSRDIVQQSLNNVGVGCAVYYPLPLHQQPCFVDIVPEGFSLPETELASKECLSIPIAAEINNSQLQFVAELLCK